jgi:hemolysin III
MTIPASNHGQKREAVARSVDAVAVRLPHPKPSWRGWIHAGTFPLAIVLAVVLLVAADGGRATAGAAIFATASVLLFGVSALYHRLAAGPRLSAALRRMDHANIFLLIAGTYTPIGLLSLPREQWIPLLALVWGGAALGIGVRLFWQGAPRWLYVPIYLALGWAALGYAGDLFDAGRVPMTLVLVGGLLYSAGAVVYGLKRPNPLPRTFGFHEIFHVLTVPAFLCHWSAVLLLVTNPPLR